MFQLSGAATPEYSIENVTPVHTLTPLRVPLWPTWSHDGKRLAFTNTNVNLMEGHAWLSQIWCMDLADYPNATRLMREPDNSTCGCLAFVPDDTCLLFIQYVEGKPGGLPALCHSEIAGVWLPTGITALELDPSAVGGVIFHTDIRDTPNGSRMVVDLYRPTGNTSIYAIPTDAAGRPSLSQAVEIVQEIDNLDPVRLALSPSGNELLVCHDYAVDSDTDIALITGVDNIVAGIDPPITSWSDTRVRIMNDGPNHADAPSWSEDGSLFFYGYDLMGTFKMIDMNFDQADFDVMVVRLEDALAGNLTPTAIQIPGNQGCIGASSGGTRIAFGQTADPNNQVCVATFRIADTLALDGAGVVPTSFALADGSGTTLSIPASTAVSNHGAIAGPLKISVFTPFSAIEEAALLEGTAGIPVVRDYSYENLGGNPDPQPLTLDPPASLTIVYTDAEIRGLNEEELAVYDYNPESGLFDTLLPIVSHDLEANTLVVEINSIDPATTAGAKAGESDTLGTLGVGIVDSDGDGLSDGRELRWDGNLQFNIYDPESNPMGTDLDPYAADTDGDGVSDGTEARLSMNPLDAGDGEDLPVANTLAVVLFAFLLAGVGLMMAARPSLLRR